MPAAPPLPCRAVHVPKQGHTDAEYEDAWAADVDAGRFAVADGATETSHAGLWARLLAAAFVAARRPWAGLGWLEGPRRDWAAAVDGQDLPWYAETKREQGAYATLLGLRVRAPARGRPGRWRALAIGDSCLVRVRPGAGPRSFPVKRAADFGNRPGLIGSRPGPVPAPVRVRGVFQPGDRLWLMTDALAQWFLVRCEADRRPWEDLVVLLAEPEPEAAFAAWVEDRRHDGEMRNDDVTVLAVGPVPAPSANRRE
jgi:hypothetical protein